MSTKPKTPPPEIELLPFKDLHIDTIYSGRDAKEISANAKELAPMLADGWDASQPGQYFVGEDGKKHLVAGFTRVEAARANDLKSGYFVKVDGDDTHHLTACFRTNAGKPLSRKAQGERFIALRDGVVSDDFAGAVADPEKTEDWKRKPMSTQQIAELPGIGKTVEHIKQCILVAEDPVFEEVEDLISVNAFITARQLVSKHHDNSDAKLRKVVKAAVDAAKEDGKDRATPKHFDAIKSQFIPLKAAPVKAEQQSLPVETPTNEKEPSGEDESKAEIPVAFTGVHAQEVIPATENAEQSPELIASETTEEGALPNEEKLFSGEVPKKHKVRFDEVCKIIDRHGDLFAVAYSDDDRNRLASAIVLSGVEPF